MQINKSVILSKVFKLILLVLAVAVISITLQLIGVPRSIIIIIVLASYAIFSIFLPIHIIYRSKSLRAIDRYISRNHKRPIFAYAYALAHGSKSDMEDALKRIINTYKQQDMPYIYGANLALLQHNPSALFEHAKKITGQEYKDYYLGHANVMKSNFEIASEFLGKLHTPWMIHSLKAYAALQRGNKNEYRVEMNQSIESAIGMQRYVLHHTMRRNEDDNFK